MRKKLVDSKIKAPMRFVFGDYYLVPISTKDTLEDWIVLTKNADAIVTQRGDSSRSEWPYVCTLEEDYKDLAWLETCMSYGQLYSYIIRSKKDHRYVGCVYVYPIELFYPEMAKTCDIDFSFWITGEEFDKGRYSFIYEKLADWLVTKWKFDKSKIFFRNKLKI